MLSTASGHRSRRTARRRRARRRTSASGSAAGHRGEARRDGEDADDHPDDGQHEDEGRGTGEQERAHLQPREPGLDDLVPQDGGRAGAAAAAGARRARAPSSSTRRGRARLRESARGRARSCRTPREQGGEVEPGALEAVGVRREAVGADQLAAAPARRGRRSRRRPPPCGPGPRRSRGRRGARRARAPRGRRGRRRPRRSGRRSAPTTFSPASRGSVHILVTASRALLAWMVHMPGKPGVERDEQVEALGLAHLADDDARGPHPQGLLDQPTQRDLAGALERGLPALHRGDVAVRDAQLEDLLAGDDPLAGRDGRGQAVQQGRLAGLGTARDEDVQPGGDGRLEEAGRLRASACRGGRGRRSSRP